MLRNKYEEQRGGWVIWVIGCLVFAMFLGVVWYAWNEGIGSAVGEPPLLRADAGPYRRAPNDPGGLEVANVSSSIVSVLRPEREPVRVERLLPPELEPAQPPPAAAEAARAAPPAWPPAAEAPPVGEGPLPAEPPATPPQVTAALPDRASTASPGGGPPDAVPEAAAPAESDTSARIVPVPVPRVSPPEPPPAAEAAAPDEPEIAALEAAPADPDPPVQRARAPVAADPEPPATPSPAPVTSPAPAAPRRALLPPTPVTPRAIQTAQAPVTRAPAAATGNGAAAGPGAGFLLQLAAGRNQGALDQAWTQLRSRYPEALNSLTPRVQQAATATGTVFRLQAGPFRSREAAVTACSSIRSAGGDCFIVGPVP